MDNSFQRKLYQLRATEIYKDEYLKPSMARAPRLKKKVRIEHMPGARAGIDYEIYRPDGKYTNNVTQR